MSSLLNLVGNIPHERQKSLALIVAFLVILRSRIPTTLPISLPKYPYSRRKLSEKELADAKQELYHEEADGSITLLVPFRGQLSKVKIERTKAVTFRKAAKLFPVVPSLESKKTSVDSVFFKQLWAVLRLAFRHWRSKEVGILALHSAFLVARTLLSVMVARLDGRIVRDLVSADGPGFARGIGLWFLLAIPSTYTNSMIRHLQSKLSLKLRTRLTRYIHDLYLTSAPNLRYYRIHGEGGLDGVDQFITSDVIAFCDSLAALYGNVMKPLLDLAIFNYQLSRSLGVFGNTMLWVNYLATATLLRSVTPSFARMAAVEARLEGEYRGGVARAGREAEEIAFYDGGRTERDILWRAYSKLMSHINTIVKVRIAYEWTEDFVIKYAWSAAGYLLISIPVMLTKTKSVGIQAQPPTPSETTEPVIEKVHNAVAKRTEKYIENRRLLLSIADAGGRLMYAYKDVLELAGLTTRVYTLISTLHALPPVRDFITDEQAISLDDVNICVPTKKLDGDNGEVVLDASGDEEKLSSSREGSLMDPLKLVIRRGEHLMITGPNGVGKTAIARVLSGLWEAVGGELRRPSRGVKGLFVVPQRAYMVVGTLRDQIIYPHTYTQFKAAGGTDVQLMEILKHVHLTYLPAREGGWTTVKEWKDVLSGGERQRMGMARLFYHQPSFAVLDECTSAVSTDVEGLMYQHAKDLGITLITISHRPSLAKYHKRLLTLKGDAAGSWYETRVGTEEQSMDIEREIASIEARLAEVPAWQERLLEVAKELGVSVVVPKVDA
ncbi:putative peroxisomal half ABC transporter [Clavulina sp. PMI_390]|nr:putative peroxisomal half ABC transporter [Clavulina sp. PMI_390]